MPMISKLKNTIDRFYQEHEYPALASQARRWSYERPLEGLSLIDATPVFRNTMTKYYALLAGGARLTVASGGLLPCDPAILAALPEYGIRVAGPAELKEEYDAVMDCAGILARVRSRHGRVELTRSGFYHYQESGEPVFLADGGRIKRIETELGTGDGFRRGMAHFGHGDFTGKHIVLFGCGKVGRGIALYAQKGGARVTIVDDPQKVTPPEGARIIDLKDRNAIAEALKTAWCAVSATGIHNALRNLPPIAGETLLANMGAEDEFGEAIPASRVLNEKRPLNFALEEPTCLKYIDPTMALVNQGIPELLAGKFRPGINLPTPELENPILDEIRRNGLVAPEMLLLD